MYSVVEIAGHQYKVKAGDLIDVQKLSDEVGTEVTLDKVLFVGGDKTAVGTPVVEGATVKAKIIKHLYLDSNDWDTLARSLTKFFS